MSEWWTREVVVVAVVLLTAVVLVLSAAVSWVVCSRLVSGESLHEGGVVCLRWGFWALTAAVICCGSCCTMLWLVR